MQEVLPMLMHRTLLVMQQFVAQKNEREKRGEGKFKLYSNTICILITRFVLLSRNFLK